MHLISVVIPTFARPALVPRAVESALAYQGDDVEVIIVPNGPDESWKATLRSWEKDRRVRISPITNAHGNVARNHGMSLADGKYIRFLDDDDYLLPGAAYQLEVIERACADVCSGRIASIDFDGNKQSLIGHPMTKDFVCAAVSVSGFRLPVGNLFLRTALSECSWDPQVHRAQDYAWMIDLASRREWRWVHVDAEVGIWYQHKQARTSSTLRLTGREDAIVNRLIALDNYLVGRRRSSCERRRAIAEGLWYYVQRGFPNHPLYWSHVAKAALRMSRDAKPVPRLFREGIGKWLSPLVLEWMLLPLRAISQQITRFREARGRIEYRRRL